MRINSVNNVICPFIRVAPTKIPVRSLGGGDRFERTLSFRGKPDPVSLYSLGVPTTGELTGREAIRVYDELRYPKYTDITHDTWVKNSDPSYNEIREKNLEFLDRVKGESEKARFISHFKAHTSFPYLNQVSQKITNEFYRVSIAAQDDLNALCPSKGGAFDVIRMGYNQTCSVGKKKALPGSDIDGGYIILKGTDNPNSDKNLVDLFNSYLWDNTDTRILSYNHQAAFPQVYTVSQIEALLNKTEAEAEKIGFKQTSVLKMIGARALQSTYHPNYSEANGFFIRLNSRFEDKRTIDYNNPSKELVKNFGFFIETFGEGAYFDKVAKTETSRKLWEKIINSTTYQFTNLSQIHALKKEGPEKKKMILRTALSSEFHRWPVDKQYAFVKEVIRASCGQNNNREIRDYFAPGPNRFKPLLKALGKPCE